MPVIVLRPEPGASKSIARAMTAGLDAIAVPLFVLEPLAWQPPPPEHYQALLLTSANAVTLAGPQLAALGSLPARCVGDATAAAAQGAGLIVEQIGGAGAQALVDACGAMRLLWLAGDDRTAIVVPVGGRTDTIPVYRAAPQHVDPGRLQGPAVALVHSARAAQRLAEIAPQRAMLRLVAISEAVASACGDGWASVTAAHHPDDAEMVAIGVKLCQDIDRGMHE